MQITVVSKFVQTAATCELSAPLLPPPLAVSPTPRPSHAHFGLLAAVQALDAQLSFLVRNVINISLGHGLLIVFGRRRALARQLAWLPRPDLAKTLMYISVAIN